MKRLLVFLVIRLRLLAIWRYWHRKRITIVTLHGVSGENLQVSWAPLWGRPTTGHMRSAIRQLSQHYTFISMDRAVSILDGSSAAIDYGMVLTFDDGYRNNFSDALPLLEELGVPATFFIATGFVESGSAYWVDRLDYALQHAPVSKRLLSYKGQEFDFRGDDRRELATRYRDLRVSIKNNEADDESMLRVVEAFAEDLESSSGTSIRDIVDNDPYVSIATWSEQRAANVESATMGSHSVDHYRLTAIPRAAVDAQVVDSKIAIEKNLGRDCDYFCYPNGSYNNHVLERVGEAGYRAAVTTVRGLNGEGDDLLALKRYPLPLGDNLGKNLLQISGIYETWVVKALQGRV